MTKERKLRMFVEPDYHRNIGPLGDWDGTWDESFVYAIYDENGEEVERWGHYHTAEQAREAGEKALKRMEERR